MPYSKDAIIRVLEANDIFDVISQYVILKKSGKDFKGLCPFHHEKTPSFNVSQEKQLYHCFGCHASGNVITFIMNIENLSFVEAVKYLADRAGIIIEEDRLTKEDSQKKKLIDEIYKLNRIVALYYYRKLYAKTGQAALEYLNKRGIDDKTIRKFGLGFSSTKRDELATFLIKNNENCETAYNAGLLLKNKNGKYYDRFLNRIMFPIIDERNKVVGFGGRVMDKSMPKYLNTSETPVFKKGKILYGINFAKKSKSDKFVIVEGYMDAIALHQSGIDYAVASLGTALTIDQAKLIKKYKKNIVISYDADEAGVNATLRGLNILDNLGLNISILMVPNGKDPDEFVRKEGFEAFNKLLQKTDSLIEYKIKIYKKNLDLKKPDDRIRYIKNICSDLSNVKDVVKRDVYISMVSNDVQIPENTIRAEIQQFVNRSEKKNINNRYTVGNIRHNNKYDRMKQISPIKYLIALLLFDNKLFNKIEKEINIDEITDEMLKPLLISVVNMIKDNKEVKINDISYMMQDNKLINEFNDIFSILYNDKTINEKILVDCINKIKKENLRYKILNVKKTIKESNISGDIDVEKRLLLRLQSYEKEMLMLKNGGK